MRPRSGRAAPTGLSAATPGPPRLQAGRCPTGPSSREAALRRFRTRRSQRSSWRRCMRWTAGPSVRCPRRCIAGRGLAHRPVVTVLETRNSPCHASATASACSSPRPKTGRGPESASAAAAAAAAATLAAPAVSGSAAGPSCAVASWPAGRTTAAATAANLAGAAGAAGAVAAATAAAAAAAVAAVCPGTCGGWRSCRSRRQSGDCLGCRQNCSAVAAAVAECSAAVASRCCRLPHLV
mmetsp:Transcript_24645/g.71255  ORF Transcript_24645/g.71255 Transcript_24645/m.71255 type:complete len:238 (+) Transcript_24645:210-923(+)